MAHSRRGGGVGCLLQFIEARKAWEQEQEAAGHMTQSGSRKRWMPVLSSISPFLSVQDPSPWYGASHLSLHNLETSSQSCPEAALLGGPSSLLVDRICHHTCLEQNLESEENWDIKVVSIELPCVSLLGWTDSRKCSGPRVSFTV